MLFQISLLNFYKIRILLLEKLHLQPSELDSLPYYEYEYTVELYNEMLKERKEGDDKKQKTQEDKYNIKGMQQQATQSMPKMPSTSSSPGSFKMPKLPTPKMR